MAEMAFAEARVLHVRAVQLAAACGSSSSSGTRTATSPAGWRPRATRGRSRRAPGSSR